MLLHDILDYRAREHPEEEFAVQGSRTLSYATAQALANRIGNALAARGLAPGDRVALLSKNSIEYFVPGEVVRALSEERIAMTVLVPAKRELRERYWTGHSRRVS